LSRHPLKMFEGRSFPDKQRHGSACITINGDPEPKGTARHFVESTLEVGVLCSLVYRVLGKLKAVVNACLLHTRC